MITRLALQAALILSFAGHAWAQEGSAARVDPDVLPVFTFSAQTLNPALPPVPPLPQMKPSLKAKLVPPQNEVLNDLSHSLRARSAQEVLASIEGQAIPEPLPLTPNDPVTVVRFKRGETSLSYAMRQSLRKENIKSLKALGNMRIELHAFSSKHGSHGTNGARHIALARALVLKKFLTDHKIKESRIDIFPHGFEAGREEQNVVDIHLTRAE